MTDRFRLIIGSAHSLQVDLLNEASGPMNLTGLTVATLEVREDTTSVPILTKTGTVVGSSVTFDLVSGDTVGAAKGSYLGQVKLTGSGSSPVRSVKFYVDLEEAVAT